MKRERERESKRLRVESSRCAVLEAQGRAFPDNPYGKRDFRDDDDERETIFARQRLNCSRMLLTPK